MATFPIETKRLWIRHWRPEDVHSFSQINSDPLVMEYFPRPWTLEETKKFIEDAECHFETYGHSRWALEEKSTGHFLGYTGFKNIDFSSFFTPGVEMGWMLSKSYWGRGLITEAAQACLHFAREEIQLKKIYAFTVPSNLRSLAVMKRLRMNPLARGFEHPHMPLGHALRPHLLFELKLSSSPDIG